MGVDVYKYVADTSVLKDRIAELEGTLEQVRSFIRARSFTETNIAVLTKVVNIALRNQK